MIIVTQLLNLALALNHDLPPPAGSHSLLEVNQTKLNQIKPKHIFPPRLLLLFSTRGTVAPSPWGARERICESSMAYPLDNNSLPPNKLQRSQGITKPNGGWVRGRGQSRSEGFQPAALQGFQPAHAPIDAACRPWQRFADWKSAIQQ